jgi:AraC-like DNA-binding protein
VGETRGLDLVLELAHEHREIERSGDAAEHRAALLGEPDRGLEQSLHVERGPDLDVDASVRVTGVREVVPHARRDHDDLAGAGDDALTPEPETHRALDDLEALLLMRVEDPQIGRASTLVHREPARAWTLASLADEVAMSRSAFAARFTELVGEPAMAYVAHWRMHLALYALKERRSTVAELAAQLGYHSEAAFTRAFKRVIGTPPGAIKRTAELGIHPART